MTQLYYAENEAALALAITPERLRELAKEHQVRSFADRGTWRFRNQDIEQLAQTLGITLPPKEEASQPATSSQKKQTISAQPESQVSMASSTRKQTISAQPGSADAIKPTLLAGQESDGELFDFELSSDGLGSIDLGVESSFGIPSSQEAPPPTPKTDIPGGGDDDVELSIDGGVLGFAEDDGLPPPLSNLTKIGHSQGGGKTSLSGRGHSLTSLPGSEGASGKTGVAGVSGNQKATQLAEGMESGDPPPFSEDTLPSAEAGGFGEADNDVNLDLDMSISSAAADIDEMPMTEEVHIDDLDAQMRAEEAGQNQQAPFELDAPSNSPFELSESDLLDDPGAVAGESSLLDDPGAFVDESTSPSGSEESPRDSDFIPSGSSLDDDNDEVQLGELDPSSLAGGSGSGSGASGINFHLPADTGVNLETGGAGDGGDELEFELSIDADSTPAPSLSSGAGDSSEFELTLDEDGELAPLDDSSIGASDESTEEKDIFESDIDGVGLDESTDGTPALDDADTDLESSDFEFDPNAESGSGVVALSEDEEDADASAAHGTLGDDEDDLIGSLSGDPDEEADDGSLTPALAALAPPAPWGPVPVIFLLPSVFVMFFLGLMSLEILHGMWSYQQSYTSTSVLIRPISELFGAEYPKDQD